LDERKRYPSPAGAVFENDVPAERRRRVRKIAAWRPRRAILAHALNRLEREHVALLLAICDLEGPSVGDNHTPRAVREALMLLLRDDLRQTQRALSLAAHGTYGVCETCRRPLAMWLLSRNPALTRCATCAGRASTATASTIAH
jgi:DnaK suppressor protein